MSAPTDVCQCGHDGYSHVWHHSILTGCNMDGCDCLRFTARGLPPESQGETSQAHQLCENKPGRPLETTADAAGPIDNFAASYDGRREPLKQTGESSIQAGSNKPQTAEPCAQGVEAITGESLGRELLYLWVNWSEAPSDNAVKLLQARLDQAAAASAARIAELEAHIGERNSLLFAAEDERNRLTDQLSEVTRERDALRSFAKPYLDWLNDSHTPEDAIREGMDDLAAAMRVADQSDETKEFEGADGIADVVRWLFARREELTASLAASETDRERLRAALVSADEQLAIARAYLPRHGTFGEEGVDTYEGVQRKVRAALAPALATEVEA